MLARWLKRRRRRREWLAMLSRGVERQRRWLAEITDEYERAVAFARLCARTYGPTHPMTVERERFAAQLDHARRRAADDVRRADALLRSAG